MSDNRLVENEIKRFKMDLLRKMPFYGDIVMRLPFVENGRIATARTDGGKIEYNPKFLSSISRGQRNFVLMHEVFHVLLFHCTRSGDRDPKLWNTAADMIVNDMLKKLTRRMHEASIPFERPKDGIFANVLPSETVENLYEKLLIDNRNMKKNSKTVLVNPDEYWNRQPVLKEAPDDIVLRDQSAVLQASGASDDVGLSEQLLFDEKTGKPLNNNLLDYKLSTFMDHPRLEGYFIENPEPTSPFGTKSLGEPPTCSGAPAIRNAILNATGIAINHNPINPHVLYAEFCKAGLIRDAWQKEEE